jgi:hypothetical protein
VTQPPRGLYWSATIVTFDGSDTSAYGEPCEPGRGYTERSGWWDPDGDYWRVHDRPDDASAEGGSVVVTGGRVLTGSPAVDRHPLVRMLRALDLPTADYVVFGSGPLLPHGLRGDLGDLDIVARGAAWHRLTTMARPVTCPSGHGRMVRLQIEAVDRWLPGFDTDRLIAAAEYHAGIPFVPLAEVCRSKRLTGRPKDRRDLALIDARGPESPAGRGVHESHPPHRLASPDCAGRLVLPSPTEPKTTSRPDLQEPATPRRRASGTGVS